MQIEVGKTYITECEDLITIVKHDKSIDTYYGSNGLYYTKEGRCPGVNDRDVIAVIENSSNDDTNPKDLLGIKKPPLSLIPPVALIHESLAFQDGAKKYEAYNWRSKKVQAMIYIDAIMRHAQCYLDREDFAEDSKVHHLGHLRACAGILLDAIETGNLIDNRPPVGKASEVIKRFTQK